MAGFSRCPRVGIENGTWDLQSQVMRLRSWVPKAQWPSYGKFGDEEQNAGALVQALPSLWVIMGRAATFSVPRFYLPMQWGSLSDSTVDPRYNYPPPPLPPRLLSCFQRAGIRVNEMI